MVEMPVGDSCAGSSDGRERCAVHTLHEEQGQDALATVLTRGPWSAL